MNVTDTIILWGAVVLALTAITVGLGKVYKIAKRIDEALGVDEQGRSVSHRLQRVEYQLWPNGGGSIADKLDANIKEQKVIVGRVDSLENIVTHLVQRDTKNA